MASCLDCWIWVPRNWPWRLTLVDLVFCLLVPPHIQIVFGIFSMPGKTWALRNEQFILDNALGLSGFGCYKEAFWSALCVYPEQFSLQITVIWENIKGECFTEIIPYFWTSQIACTWGSLFGWHVKTPPQYPDLSVCGSGPCRKLLKLCNSLYRIFPFVPVIHVTHVLPPLISLLSVSK